MGTAIEVNHVWKKFYRGEFNDSLRDAIPAMFKSMVGLGPSRAELQKNEFWALKDVNFKVEEGESVALIGHNGAGKSTLLKIFSKILKPNRGNIKANIFFLDSIHLGKDSILYFLLLFIFSFIFLIKLCS